MYTYYITDKELNNLTLYHSCSEKNIYNRDNYIIKKYNILDEDTFKKIIYLNSLNLNFTTNPTHILKVDNKYMGYVTNKKNGFVTIDKIKDNLSVTDRYDLLLKIKCYLDELHKLGITYGNINPKSIITNGYDIYFTDIVDSKFNKYDFSIYSKEMINYQTKKGKMDYNLDNYMLNLLTIYFLNDIEYDNILNNVINCIEDYFNNKEAKEIIGVTDNFRCINITSKMYNPSDGINELLIDNIDIKKYNEKVKRLN